MYSYRYAPPLFSGVLFALVFFPFYLWPLALVALAPLFYFAGQESRGLREVFLGGAITGVVGIGPLIYLSLAQLTLFTDAVAFTYLIRASSIPALFLVAALFGALTVSYRTLASYTGIFAPLTGGALYVLLVEAPMFWIFDGYYYGALSHALVPLPGALTTASLGGAALVSFFTAAFSSSLAEGARLRAGWFFAPAALAVVWIAVAIGFAGTPAGTGDLRVAVVQGDIDEYLDMPTDLLIYPSSTENPNITPRSSSPTLIWTTVEEDGTHYDEYVLWQGDAKSVYRKRELYALSDDYTPAWLRRFGIEKSSVTITPGGEQEVLAVGEVALGALICSELHQEELSRTTAAGSNVLVAVGSDAMFPGPLSGDFSLAAAQLRAAENGTPVIRGNLIGPSAIIDARGAVQRVLEYGQAGVLTGVVALQKVDTVYAKTGSWPVFAFALLWTAAAIALRRWGRCLSPRFAS